MTALDAAATGEDRGHLLRPSPRPTRPVCLVDGDGRLRGFVVRAPWGGGATIAPDVDDALAILHARRVAAGPDHASAPACWLRTRPASPAARRRLDGVVARAAAHPWRPAALGPVGHLGPVQPRLG